jgi:hypothetical protein
MLLLQLYQDVKFQIKLQKNANSNILVLINMAFKLNANSNALVFINIPKRFWNQKSNHKVYNAMISSKMLL